ncbi:MAG: N-6 DNA methylase [Acidimicrobiales bacterium]
MAPARPSAASDAGARHEQALAAAGRRKAQGAYYTPPAVVAEVLDLALAPVLARASADGLDALLGLRVVDPACGSGNFLAAAAMRLRGRSSRRAWMPPPPGPTSPPGPSPVPTSMPGPRRSAAGRWARPPGRGPDGCAGSGSATPSWTTGCCRSGRSTSRWATRRS